MQANRKIHVSEKAPIYMLPRSKAPKCGKFSITNTGADFKPEIFLLTKVPLQEFPFLQKL